MGPKKANAFMLFVFDRKKEAERNGEKLTVPEAVDKYGDEWRTLPKEQRLPYEEKAKNAKAGSSGERAGPGPGGALAAHMRRNFGGPERPARNATGDDEDIVFENLPGDNQPEPQASGPGPSGRGRGTGRGYARPRVLVESVRQRQEEADQEVPDAGW